MGFTGTVGGDARLGIHLAIKLGDEYKCQTITDFRHATRPFPNLGYPVEGIPDLLRTA